MIFGTIAMKLHDGEVLRFYHYQSVISCMRATLLSASNIVYMEKQAVAVAGGLAVYITTACSSGPKISYNILWLILAIYKSS